MSGHQLRCRVCRRAAWMTRDGLTHHLVKDHSPQVVAEELVKATVPPPSDPCGKRCYPTEDHALRGLLSTWASHSPRRHERRAYACPRCNAWHLTSQPERTTP